MVHNGIEYGDMQMICETYQMMKEGLGMTNSQMHECLAEWNKGELDSYLIEITRDILGYRDEDGNEVIDLILDTAGQKGTGKWTAIEALNLGQPLTLIGEAPERFAAGTVRLENYQLRAGLSAYACRRGRIQMEPQLRRDSIDVAGRLYHSLGLFR